MRGSKSAGTGRAARRLPRMGVLSVHYRLPPLLADQHKRLRGCVAAVAAMGWELWYFPVVHAGSRPEVAAVALAMSDERASLPTAAVDLSRRPLPGRPHKEALIAAYRRLRRSGQIAAKDLVAVMDHDAHPLCREAMAAGAERLLASGAAGLGNPQWHRRRCYLHPSFLLARAATLDEVGPELAFASRRDGQRLGDTGEGFTVWCEEQGRSIYPLAVLSTAFPWRFWASENVPDGRAELVGEHGERVQVGHLMRYGLPEGPPLLSHVWSVTLGGRHFSDHAEEEVLAAYFAEPFE
jgi:hypothetical protein